MKYLMIALLLMGSQSFAKTKKVPKDVGTEFKFNGLNVNGRYNMPSESVIRVEDEKSIDNLIFIRGHFRDRIKESYTRN